MQGPAVPAKVEAVGRPPAMQETFPQSGHAWYTVGVLVIVSIIALLDRQVMSLLVQPIRRGANRPVRSQGGNIQELRLARTERQPLRDESGPESRRVVFLGIPGRSGPLEHNDRQGHRISVPACRDYVQGVFPRCAGPHVVCDALEQ